MICPDCKHDARFKEYRRRTLLSLMGEIRIHRAYYYCSHCRKGRCPWDEILGLTSRCPTPGAAEILSLAGVQEAFDKASAWTVRKISGLRVSESTVLRITQETGARVDAELKEGRTFGPSCVWDWNEDHEGKSCAYVSLDATGVMMQGENGAKAEGRMAYVGMVFNPQPSRPGEEELAMPCEGVRYVAGHYTLAELGARVRTQAASVGVSSAERWIALSDGGNGFENWIEVHFPGAVKILDFRHATDYLNAFAKKYRRGEEAKELMSSWCHLMKHEGGAAILKVLEGLDRREMSSEAQEELDRAQGYIGKNVARMDYPEYQRQGWQIATGAMESACKTVVNQRLCMGGMRWVESGSDSVCHLRALYRSDPDQWDAFWGYAMAT